MQTMTVPDLGDKIVLVYMINRSPEESVLLCNARFEAQGGRVFLIGEFAEGASANDWVAGVTTALSWDCVEQYFIFDSLEEYMNRASKAYSHEQFH